MFRRKFLRFVFTFVFFGVVISWTGKGFAFTLDFEGQSFITGTYLNGTDYGGFIWDNNIIAMENSFYKNTYNNTIDFPSNDIAIVNAYGAVSVSISRNQPFDFIGAYFSTFAKVDDFFYDSNSDEGSSLNITLTGYNGATLVGTVSFDLNPTFSFHAVNFESITRLELQSSGDKRWWIMDDLGYDLPANVVPEPQTVGMFLLFIGGLPFVHKRKK